MPNKKCILNQNGIPKKGERVMEKMKNKKKAEEIQKTNSNTNNYIKCKQIINSPIKRQRFAEWIKKK